MNTHFLEFRFDGHSHKTSCNEQGCRALPAHAGDADAARSWNSGSIQEAQGTEDVPVRQLARSGPELGRWGFTDNWGVVAGADRGSIEAPQPASFLRTKAISRCRERGADDGE